MSKRYAILGLSVVFALALAVPALGGPSNLIAKTSANVKKTANKALKNANSAKKTANAALSAAGSAQSDANKAQSEAVKALTEAKKGVTAAAAAQTTANTAKSTADAAKTAAAAAEANANSRLKGAVQVFGESSGEATTITRAASVSCTGRPVLGGGFSVGGAANKVTVTQSEEQLYGGGWFVIGQTIAGQGTPSWSITAVAVCGTTS
jgi:hypothetical protein